ncbi:uncharacterized protein LOC9660156 isoform X2 [Selaginella moellendorffii]|uniref:uncharacterized protein LOC9660156 isoform X2 n=1 Tax=Selaginella moellendorffii TaxID=88036 RepID=UPI000D1C37B3|nr:uncharacterized protein LOC9660156 isoform X2 [Selaginella moellendorffii]|eukprot:XP_024539836.1 uncharacterized protein LOC9660156 isoform X2 [Selaginella moellendorffii]
MCPEPKISSFPEEPKSPHLLLHESKRCAGEDSFERFVSGFTSLPKPLSEFGRDLAEAVRDEAAEKHRAVKDRATSEGSIANFRVFFMGFSLAFVWKSPGLQETIRLVFVLSREFGVQGIGFRNKGRRAYTLRS